MLKKLVALVAFACLSMSVTSSHAQGHNEICLQQVDDLCGMVPLTQCFQDQGMWAKVYNECVGDVQTMIEMDREAAMEQSGPSAPDLVGTYAETGYSYGGVLRTGPGMNYRRAGSLVEGDWVEIIAATGDWFNGYQWYYVNTPLGEGYHWGGIFCTELALEGVLTTCSEGF